MLWKGLLRRGDSRDTTFRLKHRARSSILCRWRSEPCCTVEAAIDITHSFVFRQESMDLHTWFLSLSSVVQLSIDPSNACLYDFPKPTLLSKSSFVAPKASTR